VSAQTHCETVQFIKIRKLRFLTICGDTCDEPNLKKKSERVRFKSAENLVHLTWNDP
jgi:hypothetical protein